MEGEDRCGGAPGHHLLRTAERQDTLKKRCNYSSPPGGTMRRAHHLLLPAAPPTIPSFLASQQRGVEIGLDSRALYELDSRLLLISVPLGRARAAFPSGDRLAFEPAFSFARISADGGSVTAMVFEVGAVYDFSSA